jgi:uncharacterized protein (DUF362 family)
MSDSHRVLAIRTDRPAEHAARLAEFWSELRGRSGRVLFKPNLIHHRHRTGGDYMAVVTHPAVLDAAWASADLLSLTGPRVVADAPQSDADFDEIVERTGLARWGSERGVELIDLRKIAFEERRDVVVRRHELPGDPAGAVMVDLGELSAFYGLEGRTYYGADYDIEYTNENHRGGIHRYLFSGTALSSDLVVNLPKLKTHKKAGVTLSMKNLVGLNADKNLLPHHTFGTPSSGGDAYMDSARRRRLEATLLRAVKPVLARSEWATRAAGLAKPLARRVLGDTLDVVRSGNWWGNDTVWRMILDLDRILLYARPDGSLADTPQRETLVLVDGVVAGQGAGPDAPDPYPAGVVVAGTDFVAVDIAAATFMGFDYRKIPHLARALDEHPLPLTHIDPDRIVVESDVREWDRNLWEIDPGTLFRLRPHFGWAGHIERDPETRNAPAAV